MRGCTIDMQAEVTIVAIGKNEASRLPHLVASIKRLSEARVLDIETIYVDSASTDSSVEIAKECFDRVLVLKDSPNLCAAAGRYIGTLAATKNWVLYVDADMEICDEFVAILPELVSDESGSYGYIGKYNHLYGDGSRLQDGYGSINKYERRGSTFVKHFGGSVLLPRLAVLEAGNYNPSIFSNEEIDLYCRLRGLGLSVRFMDVDMIQHRTERFTRFQKLLGSFFPTKVIGKKYFGFGQLLASRIKGRQLGNLIRYFPYPFVFWSGLISFVIFMILRLTVISLFVLGCTLLFIHFTKGFRFIALYFAFAFQAILGWTKYDPRYVPQIDREYASDRSSGE